MTQPLIYILAIVIGYVLGSVPFGLLIVKLSTGKDIRQVASGRTGGTNAMRAAGFWAGMLTAVLDILKGACAVWIANALTDNHLIHILAPIAAILGHNYSIFLPNYDESGKFIGLRGGAGGAPAAGGAMGLWGPSMLIIFPMGLIVFFTFGYASITTIFIAVFATIIFTIRALNGMPWLDALYGVIATLLLFWALRPNIKSLIDGNERVVSMSLHGKIKARREAAKSAGEPKA